jgi:hypothetical protein
VTPIGSTGPGVPKLLQLARAGTGGLVPQRPAAGGTSASALPAMPPSEAALAVARS